MTDTYKISVIIPFFNAVKYINQCLESLALQDFKFPYEIIMIDDCSTDESLKLIKNHKNFNLKIFQLSNNSGPSAARNIGLSKANGNYIFFLDIDDIIEKNTLSKLYETALEKDYDLVFQDSNTGALENAGNVINRRQFLRYGFNTATGVLAASLGVLGFASR